MTIVAKYLPSADGLKEVLVVLPDGRTAFATTPMQLWDLVRGASGSKWQPTSIHAAARVTDWIAERQELLTQARSATAEATLSAVKAYEERHGVQVFATQRVLSSAPARRPAPAPKAKPKLTLSPELEAMVKDLF